MKKISFFLIPFFSILFAVSCFFVFGHLWQDYKSKDLYQGLAETVTDASEDNVQDTEIPYEEKPILPEYAALYEQNSDLVGWIQIPDTQINYPVVQTPNSPNYYLRRGFDDQYALCGCPYMQENCNISEPSDNLIIYGHNMKNGTMFSDLTKLEDKEFWQDHKTLSFNTLKEKQSYEIISVFKTFVYSDSPESFQYYRFVNAESPQDFDAFIKRCKELALYETNVSAEYGDKLITLSTCEYSKTNGRLVLVAKKIPDPE